jgi:hypothetical protein
MEKLFSKKFNGLELIITILVAILVLPYLILSSFNAPAVDDYSYALKTIDFGFWGGQMEAYKQWNGRYFSSFILCMNLLLANNFLLYKVLPLILILGNTHATYRLSKIVLNKQEKLPLFLFSFLITLVFLNNMPSITQGIYWAPGAITYNLGNIMVVYLIGFILQSQAIGASKLQKVITIVITILSCGLNESSMVAVDLIIIVFLLYTFIDSKKINTYLLLLLITAFLCTIIMAISPGNHIRDTGFLDPHKKNVMYTIMSSFSSLIYYLSIWLFNWRMLVISICTVLFFAPLIDELKTVKLHWVRFIIITFLGFSIVAAAFAPGFWSTGYIAPDRTINAVYWLFLIWWFAFLFALTSLIRTKISNFELKPVIFLGAFLLVVISFFAQELNFSRALSDLVTGRGYVYSKELKNRLILIKKGNNASICELPEFSGIPGTIFHEDIKADEEDWFNKEFARYYKLNKVRLGKKVATAAKKISVNFETDGVKFKNPVNLSTAFANSKPNSNLLDGQDTYSATYEVSVNEIDPTGLSFKSVVFNANVLSTASDVNYVLVVSINDNTGKNIFWQGKEIISDKYSKDSWNKESYICTIKESAALNPENSIAVYIWNRSKNAIYVDDMDISFE